MENTHLDADFLSKLTTGERRRMIELMFQRAATGGTLVVGTQEAMKIGTTMYQREDQALVVKRRATRDEFLRTCPGLPGDIRITTPFYYELMLLKQQVFERGMTIAPGGMAAVRLADVLPDPEIVAAIERGELKMSLRQGTPEITNDGFRSELEIFLDGVFYASLLLTWSEQP